MASLEYVTAGWLRSRRLTVASAGAGGGCGGLCPRPMPRLGGGLGPGDFLPGGGRLGWRGGGLRDLADKGGPQIRVIWHRQKELDQGSSAPDKPEGHTLELNSAHPIGLRTDENKAHRGTKYTGELPPEWSKGRRYWIVPSHRIQSPVWSLRKGCWTFAPFSNPGYASGGGGACGRREDDEDAWSGWGGGNDGREDDEDAWSGFAGWVGGAVGGLGCCFRGRVGGGCDPFLSRSLWWTRRWWGWGGVGLEEGVRSLLARIP